MMRIKDLLSRSSFRRQLTIAVAAGVVLIALLSSVASSLQGSRQIRAVLQAQGQRIAENLAQQSALAVIYKSADHAADALKITLGFPDVIAVEIRDEQGKPVVVRGHDAAAGERSQLADPAADPAADLSATALARIRQPALEAETADTWRFVAPILVQAQGDSPLTVEEPSRVLGYVRVVLSKATLTRMRGEIFTANLGAAFVFAVLFLFAIRALTARMTRPLSALSATMARAEHGEAHVQADASAGPRDIADMARAFNSMMAALREREERFRSLVALSSDWYWERDAEGRLTLLSQGFAEITGIDRQEMLGTQRGENSRFQYPPDQWRDCEARIAAREPFYGLEWQLVRPDGEMRHGTTSGEPVFDAHGTFRGYRGIGKDTTAIKLAESAQQSVIRLRAMVEHLPAGAVYIDNGSLLLNRAAEAITGYTRNEITSIELWFERVFGAAAERVRAQYSADRAAQFAESRELLIVRKDGMPRVVEFAAYGDAYGEVWLLHDISERKRNETALMAVNEQLERGLAELERTQREISLLSELSSFLHVCPTEAEATECIGEYGPRLWPTGAGALYLADETGDLLVEKVRWGEASSLRLESFAPTECWAVRRGQPYRADRWTRAPYCRHLTGQSEPGAERGREHGGEHRSEHRIELNGQRGGDRGAYVCLPLMAQARIFGLLVIEHRDVADELQIETRHRLAVALAEQAGLALANIRLRETLRQQSIREPLTGLFNRRYMQETLRRELARAERKGAPLAVVLLDLDHFKRFNDTFGHEAGDAVLVAVARALEQSVRVSDLVCRLGGEEFVVLLAGVGAEMASERAENLLHAIRQLSVEHGQRSLGRITASLGLALYPDHGKTADALIEAADAALYDAKSAGRDRYAIRATVTDQPAHAAPRAI